MKRFRSANCACDSLLVPLVAICICQVGGSCSSGAPSRANVVASPSSVIELIEDLRVGKGEAEGEPIFRGIRHVAVDDDGSMYIVDTQPGTIVHVNRNGAVIRNIGSRGSGPGEFGYVYSVSIAGDSINVLRNEGRVAVFDRASGAFRNQYTFPETPPHKVNTIVINTGKRQIVRMQDAGPITADGAGDGRVMLMELGGTYYRELFVLPDRQLFTYPRPDGGAAMSGYAYSRAPHCATAGGRAYCGWSDSLRFHIWTADGAPDGVLRADFDPSKCRRQIEPPSPTRCTPR